MTSREAVCHQRPHPAPVSLPLPSSFLSTGSTSVGELELFNFANLDLPFQSCCHYCTLARSLHPLGEMETWHLPCHSIKMIKFVHCDYSQMPYSAVGTIFNFKSSFLKNQIKDSSFLFLMLTINIFLRRNEKSFSISSSVFHEFPGGR